MHSFSLSRDGNAPRKSIPIWSTDPYLDVQKLDCSASNRICLLSILLVSSFSADASAAVRDPQNYKELKQLRSLAIPVGIKWNSKRNESNPD